MKQNNSSSTNVAGLVDNLRGSGSADPGEEQQPGTMGRASVPTVIPDFVRVSSLVGMCSPSGLSCPRPGSASTLRIIPALADESTPTRATLWVKRNIFYRDVMEAVTTIGQGVSGGGSGLKVNFNPPGEIPASPMNALTLPSALPLRNGFD